MASKNEVASRQPVTNCNRLGNVAKMREALANIVLTTIKAGKSISCDVACGIISSTAKAALSTPPRNCDRPECATTKAAQEVWRKEDGGKTAYYEWLLATSTKGEAK